MIDGSTDSDLPHRNILMPSYTFIYGEITNFEEFFKISRTSDL